MIETIENVTTKLINILLYVRHFRMSKIETFKNFVIDYSKITTIIIIKIQLMFINFIDFTTINKDIEIQINF